MSISAVVEEAISSFSESHRTANVGLLYLLSPASVISLVQRAADSYAGIRKVEVLDDWPGPHPDDLSPNACGGCSPPIAGHWDKMDQPLTLRLPPTVQPADMPPSPAHPAGTEPPLHKPADTAPSESDSSVSSDTDSESDSSESNSSGSESSVSSDNAGVKHTQGGKHFIRYPGGQFKRRRSDLTQKQMTVNTSPRAATGTSNKPNARGPRRRPRLTKRKFRKL